MPKVDCPTLRLPPSRSSSSCATLMASACKRLVGLRFGFLSSLPSVEWVLWTQQCFGALNFAAHAALWLF